MIDQTFHWWHRYPDRYFAKSIGGAKWMVNLVAGHHFVIVWQRIWLKRGAYRKRHVMDQFHSVTSIRIIVFLTLVIFSPAVWAQAPRIIPHIDSEAMVVDGQLGDWVLAGLSPLLVTEDFKPWPREIGAVTTGPSPSPDDLEVAIWLGWSSRDGRLYVFALLRDDHPTFIQFEGDFRGDMLQIAVDADRSGGPHLGFRDAEAALCRGTLGDPCDAAAIHNNRHAQTYNAFVVGPDSVDLRLTEYKDFATMLPLAEAAVTIEMNTIGIELAITPFDNLLPDQLVFYDGPPESIISDLWPGLLVSMEILIGDADAPGDPPVSYLTSGSHDAPFNGSFMPTFVLGFRETLIPRLGWGETKMSILQGPTN